MNFSLICRLSILFQFHKGTIETLEAEMEKAILNSFQFHKGTIETSHRLVHRLYVRLFQFHKGTIETGIHLYPYQKDQGFQFHKGTIETFSTRFILVVLLHFNSIKVRLRQYHPPFRS